MSIFTKCLIFIIVCSKALFANPSRPAICLNMIVKDESQVIVRCLNSLLPLIDTYVIVDTGSTDGTQTIIRQFFEEHHIIGELHERPWVDFSSNRNEAIQLAKGKGDYLLLIDADEYLSYADDFSMPHFDKDYYKMTILHSGHTYKRIQLINNHLDWEYRGVLHEVICPPLSRSFGELEKVQNIYTYEGVRSRNPQKYQNDAQVLEKALEKDPFNTRYRFYLAQSYKDAGEAALALKAYEKYLEIGTWKEEVFWALMQIAHLKRELQKSSEEVIKSYSSALRYRRSRVEPLYYIAQHYRENGNYFSGYLLSKIAKNFLPSQDILFVQDWVYHYGILLELSICAYWVGNYDECEKICIELLKKEHLPENVRACVERNLEFARAKTFLSKT